MTRLAFLLLTSRSRMLDDEVSLSEKDHFSSQVNVARKKETSEGLFIEELERRSSEGKVITACSPIVSREKGIAWKHTRTRVPVAVDQEPCTRLSGSDPDAQPF